MQNKTQELLSKCMGLKTNVHVYYNTFSRRQ